MKLIIFIMSLITLSAEGIAQQHYLPSGVYHLADRPVTKSTDRESTQLMEGATTDLSYLEVHTTTQYKGAIPRPAHTQTDIEELIFIKEGKMKFTMDKESKVLGKGSIVLIPPHHEQTLENVGDGPLTYYVLMFKSRQPIDMQRLEKAGGALMLDAETLTYTPSAVGGNIRYIQRATALFNEMEVHVTELKGKGPSHAPHTYVDTELILILEGDTEEMIGGKTYRGAAGDIYLMNSNELHGISNLEDKPCKFLAVRWR